QAQQLSGGGSVFLLPLARRNAILMFGPDLRFPYYRELIKQLDTKNTNLPIPIKLKKASAQLVANQLTQFYNQRYNAAGETSANNLTRFTYDTSSNTIFVQAGRGDLEEIQSLIDRIDSEVPLAINELRIIRLHNSPADDLANTLQVALLQNILPQGTGVVQAAAAAGPGGAFGAPLGGAPLGAAPTPAGGAPLGAGGGAFGAALGQQRPALGSAATNTTKTVSLRFLKPGKDGLFETGYLEDVHITPDVRSNSLIISAPKETMELLQEVIVALDQPSAARANVNIFTLKKADATLTANMLQQLFGAAGAAGARTTGGFPGGPLGAGGAGAAGTGFRPLLTVTGQPGEGAGLINLQVAVDDRTNSVIVAASPNDLEAIRAIIARLEATEYSPRTTVVYKLRNAGAADVATALTTLLTQSVTVIQTG